MGKTASAAVEPTKQGNRARALGCARALFIEEGYAAFSMRKVARELGISQGHLQHYFPTREDLVNAMLEETAEYYAGLYSDLMAETSGNSASNFNSVVSALLDDISNQEVTSFFLELWPLTSRNQTAAAMLNEIYQRNCRLFAGVVQQLHPTLARPEVEAMALQILALIDGLMLYVHSARPSEEGIEAARQRAKRTIAAIVTL